MSELLARHRAVIPNWVGIYYDEPIEIVSGQGCRVTDAQGRGYLDFFAGILTNMLGYDVPEVRDAVERQIASGIVHTSTLYLIRGQVELAEKIARLSGIKDAKVFFTNSGTEANETALLAALTARKATEVLAMRGSYHGRSFGAVGVTGNAAWKMSGLSPFGTHYLHGADRQLAAYASLNDADYIKACVDDLRALLSGAIHPADVACLLAEPVQGVGGFTMRPDRRALLGHRRARDHPGRDDVRQGPGQRLCHRRRGGPRRPARRDPRQRHLHLRRQPGRDRGGQRHPGLRALARPAAQRRGHRQPDHQRAPGGRAEPRRRRRGTRQGPDVRRRPGGSGHEAAQPAAGQPDARGDEGTRPADRQGRPGRQYAADGAAADADRGGSQGRAEHPHRRPHRRQRGGKRTVTKQASDAGLPAEKRAMKHCTHWIGGKPWDGE